MDIGRLAADTGFAAQGFVTLYFTVMFAYSLGVVYVFIDGDAGRLWRAPKKGDGAVQP